MNDPGFCRTGRSYDETVLVVLPGPFLLPPNLAVLPIATLRFPDTVLLHARNSSPQANPRRQTWENGPPGAPRPIVSTIVTQIVS